MKLYLIRHADAVPLELVTGDDAARPLTEAGIAQAKGLASALSRHGIALDAVATSPLLRATQTAEALMPLVINGATPVQLEWLAPGCRRRKLAKAIQALELQSLALVGHMPDLSDFAAWLIGSRKAHIDFAKAAVAHIVCEDGPEKGGGVLHWLLPPEWQSAAPMKAQAEA